eukprot:UN30275
MLIKEKERIKQMALDRMTPEEKEAYEENIKRKAISEKNPEEQQKDMSEAYEVSRREYLVKRQADIMELLRREIEWEEDNFPVQPSKEEEENLQQLKERYRIALEVDKNMKEIDEGYVMPSTKFQSHAQKNKLLRRYQEDRLETKTDQL